MIRNMSIVATMMLSLSLPGRTSGQTAPAMHRVAEDAPCCGVITADGQKLISVLDGMNVEHLWLAHEHVAWKTGRRDRNGPYKPTETHCSAFAAAVSLRLHVYLLREPEHRAAFLASAQGRWLASTKGRDEGWRAVDAAEAQRQANLGAFVVVVYVSSSAEDDPHGHIAVVRPSEKTAAQLAEDGPEVIEAGLTNHQDYVAAKSFKKHPNAWPSNVRYYAHAVPWNNAD